MKIKIKAKPLTPLHLHKVKQWIRAGINLKLSSSPLAFIMCANLFYVTQPDSKESERRSRFDDAVDGAVYEEFNNLKITLTLTVLLGRNITFTKTTMSLSSYPKIGLSRFAL